MIISLLANVWLHDNIRNQIFSCMHVFFFDFEIRYNLDSNFININDFTPHEDIILLWIFTLNNMHPKKNDFQLQQKGYELRHFLDFFSQENNGKREIFLTWKIKIYIC